MTPDQFLKSMVSKISINFIIWKLSLGSKVTFHIKNHPQPMVHIKYHLMLDVPLKRGQIDLRACLGFTSCTQSCLTLRRPNFIGVRRPVPPDLAKTGKVRSDHSKNLTKVFLRYLEIRDGNFSQKSPNFFFESRLKLTFIKID